MGVQEFPLHGCPCGKSLCGIAILYARTDPPATWLLLGTAQRNQGPRNTEHDEHAVSRFDNARWVGYDEFKLDRVKDLPKDAPIVVYCSVGYRSEKITEDLQAAGFTNVRNLYGGIFEWVNSGHPVVDDSGPTEHVHAYDRSWGRWLLRGEKVY